MNKKLFKRNNIIYDNFKEINKIIKLSFYNNFNRIVSPIIICDNEINMNYYLSSKFNLQNLFDNISKYDNKKSIFNNYEGNDNFNINNNKNISKDYYLPLIISFINGRINSIQAIYKKYKKKYNYFDSNQSNYLNVNKMKRINSLNLTNKIKRKYINDYIFNNIDSVQQYHYSKDDFKIKYNIIQLNIKKNVFPYYIHLKIIF